MNNTRNGALRSDTLALIGLVLLAACLRVGVVWLRSDEPMSDLDHYFGIAKKLAAGEGFADPKTGLPTAYRPPVYPLLLAAVVIGGGDERTIAALHALLGTLAVLLTYLIGKRLELCRGAVVAATLVAVDPLLLHYTTILMNEVVFTFLVSTLLWAGLARPGGANSQTRATDPAATRQLCGDSDAAPSSSPTRAQRVVHDFATGIVAGLCALCRPTIWAFFGMLAVWWTWTCLRDSAKSGVRLRAFVVFRIPWTALMALAITVSPWLVRNLLVLGHPVLTTTHGGYTLLLGNNPVFYREVVAAPWGTVWGETSLLNWWQEVQTSMERSQRSPTSEVDRDRWLYHQAFGHMRDEPTRFVQACFVRLVHLWNVTPLGPAAAGIPAPVLWAVVGFYVLIGLGLGAALFRLTRNEWPAWAPLVILLVSFSTVHLLYWSNARMRAPLVPAVCLLAARGFAGKRAAADAERIRK